MNILNAPVGNLAFNDIVTFCQQKIIENVTLEYKADFPKDLAKQFVTFSNTQGGLVIIGVGEDQKGYPDSWDGVANTGKLIDRVHQIAANVAPFPTYEVATTDEVKGNVFVLIRISEGSAPPYSTTSDPTPWVRTGNISTPIRAANRDELLQLLNKRATAEASRQNALEFAQKSLDLDIATAEKARQQLAQDPEKTVYPKALGVSDFAAILELSVMPFYPDRKLLNYSELSDMNRLLGASWQYSPFIHDNKSIPAGVSAFHWSEHAGTIDGAQIYMNGHVYRATDVLRTREQIREVPAYMIGHYIYEQLRLAAHIYRECQYNGQLSIHARLRGGTGAKTIPPSDSIWTFRTNGTLEHPQYAWSKTADTHSLLADDGQAKLHRELLKEICWDIGLGEIHDSTIDKFFEVNNWYPKPAPQQARAVTAAGQ